MSVIVADTLRARVAGAAVTTTEGLNVGGGATVAGAVVATSFAGDGSSITALSGSNVSSGTVAAARVATLNQDTTGTAALAEGLSGTPDITVRNVTGVAATFTGVLTYEDVTNVDSVGMVTARGGLEVGAAGVGGTITSQGNVIFAGITTIGTGLSFADNIEAKFGNSGDLRIYHDPSNAYVAQSGPGDLVIQANTVSIKNGNNTGTFFRGQTGSQTELYFNNSKKLETHNTGVRVTGVSTVTGDSFVGSAITMYASSGIVSATSFHGDGSNLSGLAGGFSNMTSLTSGSGASWSIPAGVTKIKVYCTGGGGGGGRGNSSTAAGSGGAGGTSIHYFDTSAGGTATYTIGGGGSGTNNDGQYGTSGSSSTFAYGGTTITGGGGSGGGGPNIGTACDGGAGGTASGGTLNVTGGAGGPGMRAGAAYRASTSPAGTAYWGGSTAAKGTESGNTNTQIDNLGCGGVGGIDYEGQSGSSGIIVIEY